MDDKLKAVREIFEEPLTEREGAGNTPLDHGKWHGGKYNGKKYMYSETFIKSLSLDRLKEVITKQIGI